MNIVNNTFGFMKNGRYTHIVGNRFQIFRRKKNKSKKINCTRLITFGFHSSYDYFCKFSENEL